MTTTRHFMVLALTVLLLASCGNVNQARPTTVLPTTTVLPASTIEEVGANDTPVPIEEGEIVSPSPSTVEDGYITSGQIESSSISRVEEGSADDTLGTVEDGLIADGEFLSPFDTDYAAISNLDPDLRAAVQLASTDAARDGVEMFITSGWRSVHYQQALLDEAVTTYGSLTEARKWVKTPEESTHVTGEAVDIGPTDAMSWLSQHGNDYGLCQTYANEMWHYELATAPGGTCPQQFSDASAG